MGFSLARLFNPRPFTEAEQQAWAAFTCGEDDEGEDLGAELLDSDGEAWIDVADCSPQYIGDVGRDPLHGLEDPAGNWSVND